MTGRISRAEVVATGTTTPRSLADRAADEVNLKDYTTIQEAFNHSATNNLLLRVNSGTYELDVANSIGGRDYGILIPDNLNLVCDGRDKTIFKAKNNTDMDVFTTPRDTKIYNVRMQGFTVDGNSPNQTPSGEPNQSEGGFNLWLDNIEGLYLDDVKSKDAAAFGFRIDDCYDVSIGNIYTDHEADINADGVHFKDTSNVVADKIVILTRGDDGFIINAEESDCSDYSIGELIVEAPVTVAAGRGIYISNAESNASAGIQRKLKNINIANAVLKNCDATACLLNLGEFENININFIADSCISGFGAIIGSTSDVGVTGYIKNSSITGIISNCSQTSIYTYIQDGLISNSNFDFLVSNTADGYMGAALSMKDCNIRINMNYDEDGTKISPLQGIRALPAEVFTGNTLHATVNGAGVGVELNNGHTDNTIHIGSIKNSVSHDIDFNSGADNNILTGGSIASYQNAGTGNIINGVMGMEKYGRVSTNTDANGEVVIPHGLIANPDYVDAKYFGGNSYIAYPEGKDATNITVQVRDFSGSAIASSPVQITWSAKVF